MAGLLFHSITFWSGFGFFLAASIAVLSFNFMVIVLFRFSVSFISGGVL